MRHCGQKSFVRAAVIMAALTLPPLSSLAGIMPRSDILHSSLLALMSNPRSVTAPGECPDAAIVLTGDVSTAKIHWDKIFSDRDAISCVYELAARLGQDYTRQWFLDAGFAADFIAQYPSSDRKVLLSAAWLIKKNGLLYRTGFLISSYNWMFAHSMVISVMWDKAGNIEVDYGYNYI